MGEQNHKIALQSDRGSPLLAFCAQGVLSIHGPTVSYGCGKSFPALMPLHLHWPERKVQAEWRFSVLTQSAHSSGSSLYAGLGYFFAGSLDSVAVF